jgi:hypothetical protein
MVSIWRYISRRTGTSSCESGLLASGFFCASLSAGGGLVSEGAWAVEAEVDDEVDGAVWVFIGTTLSELAAR